MSLIRKLVKATIIQKLIGVAIREARKPQNQERLRDAVRKVQQRRRRHG